MSITIGALSLPDALAWTDRSATGAVSIATRRRTDGGIVARIRKRVGGRQITLEARQDTPITRADQITLEQLIAEGAAQVLDIPNQGYSGFVLVTALDLHPLIDYEDPVDTDPVVGTITLLELS